MNKRSWRYGIAALVGAAALLVGMPGTFAVDGTNDGENPPDTVSAQNDIASFTTVFSTDVVYGGIGGLRDQAGGGDISITGVTGTVKKAYLYWMGPTNTSDTSANANITLGGSPVTGTNIGLSDDNCWSYQNSQAYRADVTSIVSGNGTYRFIGTANTTANLNGASLAVFFNDGNPANNRDVVLFDGNDSDQPNSFDAIGWNVSLPGINYTAGSASLDMVVSDGQSAGDGALILNGNTLVPAGEIWAGTSLPGAGFVAGGGGGNLWDNKSFDITSFLTPGPNTLTLTEQANSDCLALILAAVNLPAGAAPGQPAQITVTKTVAGTRPPAETKFQIDVSCTGGAPTQTITFNNDGSPQTAGDNVVLVDPLSTCTVKERALATNAPTGVVYMCVAGTGFDATVCTNAADSASVAVPRGASGNVANVDVLNVYPTTTVAPFTG